LNKNQGGQAFLSNMVQKKTEDEQTIAKRPRGRPRAYDAGEALARARDTFWRSGYSATTLDDLSAATGMNRPSLYGAFGDKRALYLMALERYIEVSGQVMDEVLGSELPLGEALMRVYDLALGMYYRAGSAPTGCFLTGTAVTEAVNDEAVRTILSDGFRLFDRAFEARLARAQQTGELSPNADPAMLGRLASAVLHSLGMRARTGEPRAVLRATAEAGVAMICGTGGTGVS
jgi:AcrR family transcriptional regulator